MAWPRFLLFNACGGVLWAAIFGLGGYLLGETMHRVTASVGIAGPVIGAIAVVVAWIALRRHGRQMEAAEERALPGPLCVHSFRKIG